MAYSQLYIQGRDANNNIVKFPVLSDGTLSLPMNTPAGAYPTYRATNVFSETVPASSVDWLQMVGSSSKTIMITRVEVAAVPGAVSPQTVKVAIARRTATYVVGGGGTLENLLAAPSAGIGLSPSYATGNTPTMGLTAAATTAATSSATGGWVAAGQLFFPGTSGAPDPVVWLFGNAGQQPLILSGTSDFLVLTFGQATTAPSNVGVTIEWYEV